MRFSGIDLHSNNCFVVIIDEADRIMYGRRLPNKLSGILAALAPHPDELDGVIVESTYNWYGLVAGLMAAGYPVHLAHTAATSEYDGLKHSVDEADAVHLAHLLHLGILPTGHICPPQERMVRDLSRKRMQLTRCRTQQILSNFYHHCNAVAGIDVICRPACIDARRGEQ